MLLCTRLQDKLVVEHTDKLFMTNAMFVVQEIRKKRVREEGAKMFMLLSMVFRTNQTITDMTFYNCHRVRYDPYTMDYFHYERIVNGKPKWLPVRSTLDR